MCSRLKAKIALLGPKEHPSFWSFHWLVLCLVQFILSSPQAELLRKTLLIRWGREKARSLETTHWYQGLQTVRNTLL